MSKYSVVEEKGILGNVAAHLQMMGEFDLGKDVYKAIAKMNEMQNEILMLEKKTITPTPKWD